MSVVERLFTTMASFGEKSALIYQEQAYSYEWLCVNARKTAGWLEHHNYNSIAFAVDNSPLNALLYLGCWCQGLNCCPINPRLKPYEITQILQRIDVDCLVVKPEQLNDAVMQYCNENNITVLCDSAEVDLIEQIAQHTPINKPSTAKSITAHISSGSEDIYKIHRHDSQQIIDYAYARQVDMGFNLDDVFLIALSINHAYAFSYQFLPALTMGLTCYLLPQYNLEQVIEALNTRPITSTALLPVMYHQLCNQANRIRTQHWRWPLVAGDYLTETLSREFKQLFSIQLRNGLGMTEVYGYAQNTETTHTANSIRVFDQINVEIKQLEPPLTIGNQQVGEVVLSGAMLPLDSPPKLATGDLGYLTEDNILTICGRKKDLIIKGGSNISPLELEDILQQHPSVDEVMVIGVKNEKWGEKIIAMVSLHQECELDLATANEFLLSYLAEYKALDDIYRVKVLPKNVTGKLDRKVAKQKITSD